MRFTAYIHGQRKTSKHPRPQRPQFEVLEERCLLSGFTPGPLVQVSVGDPFADCTADDPSHQSGTLYPDSEVETRVDVDLNDPNHIVGVWQQDRWSTGSARGLVAGVSFDGGQNWQEVVIPGLSACSGGTTLRASDPWVSFDPDGGVYSISLSSDGSTFSRNAILVNKSSDGGLTWSDPITLIDDNGSAFNDKETITADPTDSNFAYAVWDRLGGVGGRPEMFSRTTDGGQTWEPARPISNLGALDSHILVLPDGTVVDVFNSFSGFVLIRSTDKGATWSSPVQVGTSQGIEVRDPGNGQLVRTSPGLVFDAAVDPNSGNLYAVWEDARFSGFRYDSIVLSMSTDGGVTWSAPVQVNQTPTDIPPGDQQAFVPSVQVAGDGTVGVAYYDFRFNDPQLGLLTDRWFVSGSPNDAGGIDWGNEVQLTDQSFDLEIAPNANGLFVGDYQGLAAAGNSFVSFFAQTHDNDPASIFFRELVSDTGAPGCGPCGHPGIDGTFDRAVAVLGAQTATATLDAAASAPFVNSTVTAASLSIPTPTATLPPDEARTAPLDEARIERFFGPRDWDNAGWGAPAWPDLPGLV